MHPFSTRHTWSPGRLLMVAYTLTALLLAGALRGAETLAGGHLGMVDALFTATSAVTLTGLTVVDTAGLSREAQSVIFVGMLLGTIGMLSVGVGAAVLFNRAKTSSQMALGADVGVGTTTQLRRMFKLMAVVIVGTLVLAGGGFVASGLDWFDAAFLGLSGFANAGFDTVDGGLGAATGWLPALLCVLVVAGGLGFPILLDVVDRFRGRAPSLSATSKIVLVGTAVLLPISVIVFAAAEWSSPTTLGAASSDPQRLWWATTLSVMPRSAGFSFVDTAELSSVSQLLTMVLMFIGAGPAATAGGIKITGAAVLLAALVANLRYQSEVTTRRWRVAPPVVFQAVATALAIGGMVVVCAGVLVASDPQVPLAAALFDATSAATTTGLDVGVVADTSTLGSLTTTLTMLAGRVIPLVFALHVATSVAPRVRPPKVRPLIT